MSNLDPSHWRQPFHQSMARNDRAAYRYIIGILCHFDYKNRNFLHKIFPNQTKYNTMILLVQNFSYNIKNSFCLKIWKITTNLHTDSTLNECISSKKIEIPLHNGDGFLRWTVSTSVTATGSTKFSLYLGECHRGAVGQRSET